MIITFDIGGTNFRSAKFKQNSTDIQIQKTPNYLQGLSLEELNEKIVDAIMDVISEEANSDIDAIGIGFPGPVSEEGEIWGSSVIYGNKLPYPFAIREELVRRSGISNTIVMNDISAAAYYFVEEYERYCVITISSGIGNKIVVDGDIQISSLGIEGELGHVYSPFCPDVNIPCSCGTGYNHIGCLSSGRGIKDVADILKNTIFSVEYETSSLFGVDITTEGILEEAERGDFFSSNVVKYSMRPLSYAINLLMSAMKFDKIILMGGVAQNSSYYVSTLQNCIADLKVYNYSRQMIFNKIMVAPNDEYGLIGMKRYICRNILR